MCAHVRAHQPLAPFPPPPRPYRRYSGALMYDVRPPLLALRQPLPLLRGPAAAATAPSFSTASDGKRALGDLGGPLGAVVIDRKGTRVWVADVRGVVQEFSFDVQVRMGACVCACACVCMC